MLNMRAMVMLPIMLPAVLLILAGCPQDNPQRSGAAAKDAETAAARSGQGAAAADAVQARPSLPPEWPADFPPFPGAELTYCAPNGGGPETGYTARLLTAAPGEKVLEFYRGKADSAGLSVQSYANAAESGAAYFHGEKLDFTAGYDLTDDGTRVTLMFIPVVETPQVPTGSGLIPPNFPVDILPLYPGAEVLSAENMPMNNFLDMHAEDTTLKEVLDFYQEYYKELKLKNTIKDKTKDHLHYVFVGTTGGVVLDANLEPDKSVSIHLALARK
jgi:hypothetical protein